MEKNNIRKLIVITIIYSFIGTGIVQSVNENIKNDYIVDDFDDQIQYYMEMGHMPSLVVCIIKDNETKFIEDYNYSHYYKKINTTIDTAYPIASITKSFTAVAIMQIIENESYDINLDDNVSEYLPFDLKNPKYPNINITYRMLLAHQSSLGDTALKFTVLYTLLKIPFNLDTYQKYLMKGGLFYSPRVWNDYPPGKCVCYSTQGTEVLGLLIEQITNQSYADYCQQHIFNPLKMYNTSFHFSDFDREKLAGLYVWFGGIYFKMPYFKTNSYAGGAIKTTISDFSHFLIMHTSRGMYDGVRILSEESVDEMQKIQYPGYYDDIYYLHGLGWYQTTEDNETYGGHGGNWGGGRAEFRMRYSDRTAVAYFWNQNSFLLMHLKLTREEEKTASRTIKRLLFEKADEL